MSHKNSLEQRALKIIFEAGEGGIMQSELWKELGVSSREGQKALAISNKVLNIATDPLDKGKAPFNLQGTTIFMETKIVTEHKP